MEEQTVCIPKDEYIDLLRCKTSLMERQLTTTEEATLPPPKPHSWMSNEEKAEVLRLAAMGLRSGEISKRVGRPSSTIRRCINRYSQSADTPPEVTLKP